MSRRQQDVEEPGLFDGSRPPTTSRRRPGRGNELLRRALAADGVGIADVAAAVGVHPRTVSRWVGGRVPQARHRMRVAELLGCAPSSLWPATCDARGGPAQLESSAVVGAGSGIANLSLFRAMEHAGVWVDEVATAVGVDPKTVSRWLRGRVPHRRHRVSVTALLGAEQSALWPQLFGAFSPVAIREVHTAYESRTAIPRTVWVQLIDTATMSVDVLADMAAVVLDDAVLRRLLRDKVETGVRVRLCLTGPGRLVERAARLRQDTRESQPGVEVRLLPTASPVSLCRIDSDVLLSTHLPGLPPQQAPVWHLRLPAPAPSRPTPTTSPEAHDEGEQPQPPPGSTPPSPRTRAQPDGASAEPATLAQVYLDSFESTWAHAIPLTTSRAPGAATAPARVTARRDDE